MTLRERINRRNKTQNAILALSICGLIGIADVIIRNQPAPVTVDTVHTVKPNESFWSISEDYTELNTGSRKYILEMQSEIRQLNPWIESTGYELKPGDKIRIIYQTKGSN